MHEAKTHLSRLVKDIRQGSEPEVIISVDGVPSARLVPLAEGGRRRLGMDDGLLKMADDFDAPDPEIEKLFEGAG